MSTQIQTTAGAVKMYARATLKRYEANGLGRYVEALLRYRSLPWWKALFTSEPQAWDFYGVLSYAQAIYVYNAVAPLAPETTVLLSADDADVIAFGYEEVLDMEGGGE